MKTIKTIKSSCKKKAIKVVHNTKGIYCMERYETKFDSEEEKLYTIEQLPHPSGRYSDLEAAVSEARALLE